MDTIKIESSGIPHGHGMSFKKGVSDGLLDRTDYEHSVHPTNLASYRRGVEFGVQLRSAIAEQVRD